MLTGRTPDIAQRPECGLTEGDITGDGAYLAIVLLAKESSRVGRVGWPRHQHLIDGTVLAALILEVLYHLVHRHGTGSSEAMVVQVAAKRQSCMRGDQAGATT